MDLSSSKYQEKLISKILDDPKISDNTSWDTYAPVIAKPNMIAKPMVHTAVNTPISQARNRHTIRVSTVQDYPHSHARHNEILPSKFNLVNPLSGLPVSRGEAEKLRQDYRIRQLGGSEEKWRDKISTVEDERQNKVEQDVLSRLATEASNIQQRDAKQAEQFEAQQARESAMAEETAARGEAREDTLESNVRRKRKGVGRRSLLRSSGGGRGFYSEYDI